MKKTQGHGRSGLCLVSQYVCIMLYILINYTLQVYIFIFNFEMCVFLFKAPLTIGHLSYAAILAFPKGGQLPACY